MRPLAISLAAFAFATPVLADVQVREERQVFYPASARNVHLQIPFGDLEVEGTEGRDVEVHMRLECTREDLALCQERARKLRITARSNGEILRLRLKKTGRGLIQGIQAKVEVKIPAGMDLELDQKAGGILVQGMRGGLEVDSAAGDVEIRYPQERVGEVNIKVGVGEVELTTRDGASLTGTGFPRSLRWRGTGPSKIEIDMAAGDALVELR